MQASIVRLLTRLGFLCGLSFILLAQEPTQPKMTIVGAPPEPIAEGTCTFSTFGYVKLNGKATEFSGAEFGNAVLAALRQGYVLTIYPPTKSGIFVNQECHGTSK